MLKRSLEKSLLAERHCRQAQETLLKSIAKTVEGTRVAALQPSVAWTSLEDFRRSGRVTHWSDYLPLVNEALANPQGRNLFEKGVTKWFGLSADHQRSLPYTRSQLNAFTDFESESLAQLALSRSLSTAVGKTALVIRPKQQVTKDASGRRVGDAQAILSEGIRFTRKPRWLTAKEKCCSRQATFKDAVASLEKELLAKDTQVITGVPEHVAGTLRLLLQRPETEALKQKLKRVQLFVGSGTAIGPYRQYLSTLFSPHCQFVHTYSTEEAPLGLPSEIEGQFRWAFQQTLFTFLPKGSDLSESSRMLFAWELSPNEEYEVLVTTPSGLSHYRLGEVIHTSEANPLRFTPSLNSPIEELRKELGNSLNDYSIFWDSENSHVKVLVESNQIPTSDCIDRLCAGLGNVRKKELHILREGALCEAVAHASDPRLVKIPRLHSNRQVQELLESHLRGLGPHE